eukprot:TRINITY_DN33842_c0_g1_i1.p2 TRINITY_DN33842_c0_g1~~TRINITY_DN33842_c0_g1_i1.p2  ORF type:complete len:218 (+),score=45.18 TRINITY_DN33842_c0_g1_i1:106-759(+)
MTGQWGVCEWLAGQEGGDAGSDDEDVTTVCGEAVVVDGLGTTSGGLTTVAGEWGVVCDLEDAASDGSLSTMQGEAHVVRSLAGTGGAVPSLPAACKTLTAVAKSLRQREGGTVMCFLDGACIHPAHYHAHLTQCHEALFRQIEALPVHLKVPLPHPPPTPAPDDSTPPSLVHQYNRESLQIFKSWLPPDPSRGNRAFTVSNALKHYGIPDPTCNGST